MQKLHVKRSTSFFTHCRQDPLSTFSGFINFSRQCFWCICSISKTQLLTLIFIIFKCQDNVGICFCFLGNLTIKNNKIFPNSIALTVSAVRTTPYSTRAWTTTTTTWCMPRNMSTAWKQTTGVQRSSARFRPSLKNRSAKIIIVRFGRYIN